MLRLACMALLLPACDGVFGLVEVEAEPTRDAARADATLAPPPPGCVATRAPDGFDNSVPCAPWGTRFQNNAVGSVGSSQLRVDVNAANGKFECTELSAAPLADPGIVIEVSLVQGDAWFGVGNGSLTLLIYAGYDGLKLASVGSDYGKVSYDPQLMRWWRLRIDRASGMWAADYSADAQTWTGFAASSLFPVDDPVQIVLGAGAGATPTPLVNTFERINVCP